jgi:hypothetical protein
MRSHGLIVAVVVLVIAVIVIVAVMSRVPAPAATTSAGPADEDSVITLAEPVPYCPPPLQTVPHGRVQVLLDSSGSMGGLGPSVIGALRWVDQAVSRLRDSALILDELRLAQFDQRKGILSSPTFPALSAAYAPSGRTTLHVAIQSSRDYDLTFILTDGVAAAGLASGDCAAGVDAACVARALRDAVHMEQTTAVAPQPGIWLLPLWGRHSGTFYTEKPAPTANFDSTVSLQKLHDELGQNVSISNPRSDSEENLVFDYTGPRGFLLIVIARSDDLGRRAISALRERMAENGVDAVTSIRNATGALSGFPPIELYPGFLPRLEWLELGEVGDKPMSGTLDVQFVDRRRITVECAAGRTNIGEFFLDGRRVRGGSRCVDIYQLPAFEFGLVGRNRRDEDAAKAFIAGSRRETSGEKERFILTLRCGEGEERPCERDPLTVTWMAQSRYDRSRGSGKEPRSGGDAIIDSIATVDPVTQPHRIYGLDSLVSIFFDEVRGDQRRVPLADLELCHGGGAHK